MSQRAEPSSGRVVGTWVCFVSALSGGAACVGTWVGGGDFSILTGLGLVAIVLGGMAMRNLSRRNGSAWATVGLAALAALIGDCAALAL